MTQLLVKSDSRDRLIVFCIEGLKEGQYQESEDIVEAVERNSDQDHDER